MKTKNILLTLVILTSSASCDYLDIVPDNVATIEYAFRMRSTAEQYLSTCYYYLPAFANSRGNPAFFGADEFWLSDIYVYNTWSIAKGIQSKNSPLLDFWNGNSGARNLWEGISQCNIFLENIMDVPDMMMEERRQWAAEVKFLKAYYHFYLLRAYGPIPIARENFPISASGEEVRVFREPVDEVFEYVISLIDEAIPELPDLVRDESSELGRITKPIALGMKAKILVYAASPLFNGNTDYAGFISNGKPLFNINYDQEKWRKAADACRVAIRHADSLGHQLYKFEKSLWTTNVSDSTMETLTTRGIVTEKWNPEVIWASTNTSADVKHLQSWFAPRGLDASQRSYTGSTGSYGVTLKIAGMFYTKNGVPIDEDNTWNFNNRFGLRIGTDNEKYYIKKGYTTAEFNFDREPRFYGSLGFDGAIWYGSGKYDDNNPYWIESRKGQFLGKDQAGWHSVPGYFAKKLVYYTNTAINTSTYSTTNYPWVVLRLGDLYLLYAEALNELNGPTQEVYDYLNKIRERSALETVEYSWSNFSRNPGKYTTKEGLRSIIQRERTIEMMFEGQRFWDLRRWKTAPEELNRPITGWDVDQEAPISYYREKVLFDQTFSLKDYFWPIREQDLIVNKNLVQNPGW